MSDQVDRWAATFNRPFSRRDLLKAGASSALLAMLGGNPPPAWGGSPPPSRRSRRIVRAAIHPAIGIARVGNSPDEYYFGAEIPGGLPIAPDGYKDASGAMKRQAARFRIFGLDAQGRVVRELTARDATIEWTGHLANKKAAWYQFETALDIPEATPTSRRNPFYRRARRALLIDPGPRQASGRNSGAVPFDTGTFLGQPVYLGELRTDAEGRLLVLGGRGRSFSPNGVALTTFANNNGWTDDTSDGPVTARVRFGRVELPVDPAWVVVAPPNYGPALATDVGTLYDVVYQAMLDLGWVAPPAEVSFLADIFPFFDRLADLQWVNQGVLNRYGWDSPEQFLSPEYLARLADPSPANAGFREALFARFRNPDYATLESGVDLLPPLYGDAITLPPVSPRSYLAVQPFQYAALQRWAAGDFVPGVAGPIASRLEDLPIETQAAALDRAALEACLGDAFHPGCEATWPMRVASMYASPFRLLHRKAPEPDYGNVLTPEVALSADGPLAGSGPGGVTRWMAVPWQADTASCRSGYQYGDTPVDPYLPTFWAARVPNHVMPEQSYERVLDTSRPLDERREAFFHRAQFFRNIDAPETPATLQNMVNNWYRLGVVTEQPGPGDPAFPPLFKVETDNEFST
jgi:hypothetical protein